MHVQSPPVRPHTGGLSQGDGLMPHFPKPAEGSWTEHYPELGTGPISYEDSISPEFYELEREAIFERPGSTSGGWSSCPKTGSYFTKEIVAASTSVDRRARRRRPGPGVSQHLPASRQQAGVDRTTPSEETRALPAVRLQVPRVALRPRRRAHLRPAGGRVLRPRQGRLRAGSGPLRGVGGVHLREPRSGQHDVAARLPRPPRAGSRTTRSTR